MEQLPENVRPIVYGLMVMLFVVVYLIYMATDVAALVFGITYYDNLPAACVEQQTLIDISAYLIISACIAFTLLFIHGICWYIVEHEIFMASMMSGARYNRYSIHDNSQGFIKKIWQICASFVQFAWFTVGIVIYVALTADCKNTPIGKMLLSYIVIRCVFSCFSLQQQKKMWKDTSNDQNQQGFQNIGANANANANGNPTPNQNPNAIAVNIDNNSNHSGDDNRSNTAGAANPSQAASTVAINVQRNGAPDNKTQEVINNDSEPLLP